MGVAALEKVGIAGGRISGLSREVLDAYRLGFGEDPNADDPWTLPFQRMAVERVYRKSFSLEYLRDLAADFGACAALMDSIDVGRVHRDDWTVVREYLQNTAKAIDAHPERASRAPRLPDLDALGSTTPGVFRFDLLAQVASEQGIRVLNRSAASVARLCRRSVLPQLTSDEVFWFESLIAGSTVAEIAYGSGVSRSTMTRRLHRLWAKIGVENRSQAIAVAPDFGIRVRR